MIWRLFLFTILSTPLLQTDLMAAPAAPAMKVCLQSTTGAITVRQKCKKNEVAATLSLLKPTIEKGDTGLQGPAGERGPVGPTGAQGSQGLPGTPGSMKTNCYQKQFEFTDVFDSLSSKKQAVKILCDIDEHAIYLKETYQIVASPDWSAKCPGTTQDRSRYSPGESFSGERDITGFIAHTSNGKYYDGYEVKASRTDLGGCTLEGAETEEPVLTGFLTFHSSYLLTCCK